MQHSPVLIVALALVAAAGAYAQGPDTTGKSLPAAPGYVFSSNVAGYPQLSLDVCEFKAALAKDTPDFATAKKIYTAGKNSLKSNGKVRTLQGMATGNYEGEPFWDQYAKYFKSQAFTDDVTVKALESAAGTSQDPLARRETAMKSVEAGLIMAYMMHELDEAALKIKSKELSDATGAPHNVDEVAALFVGDKSECAPWSIGNKRGNAFGTMDSCSASKANAAVVKALNDARAAARKGDMKAFLAARGRVLSALTTTFVQATIEYAEQMEAARKAGKPTAEYQAEAWAFFRAIEPLVAQASASSAATVSKLLTPGNPVVAGANAQVAAALKAAYSGLGITAADVGTFKKSGHNAATKC